MNPFAEKLALGAVAFLAMSEISAATEGDRFHALLESEWNYVMEDSPTFASMLGDRRWNDRWGDSTPKAMGRRAQHDRELLAKLAEIDSARLEAQDRISYRLFKYETEVSLEENGARLWTLPINQRNGIQLRDEVADSLRFETVKDFDDWIARLRDMPKQIDETIELLRLGIAERRTHPRAILSPVPGQIRRQIVEQPERSPFYKPFTRIPAGVPADERSRLQQAAQAAIRDQVVPAYQRLLEVFEKEYLLACTEEIGCWQWPDAAATYALLARKFTTTKLTPAEIHQIGLNEVERISREMDAIIAKVGWKGTRRDFFEHLRSDERFYCKTPEELLGEYRATAKRIDPTLVKLFKTLPRLPYGVEPIPETVAPNTTAAYYRQPAADGSRAGTYFVNLYRPGMRPRYEMMALSMHEAVPGHHLQFAISFEQTDLPNFRRYGDGAYTAYVEGWGLYAESLGDELGLYDDPYSKFGQLTYEIWRACRLVVDTGMHTMKWSRQQAIDYLLDHSAKTNLDVENEIDRYITWPGQALAYKIGELKIKELRRRATEALGDRFDIREFHDVVLRHGALPLEVLEEQVNEWIAAQQRIK
jgi:prolyl oligopeptidase